MTPDNDLLRQFADHGDEAAFAELVRRHADLVYSVALRVTCNGALAQDVTQAVFTTVARQAAKLRHYETLLGWLHTTTRHIAINTVRGESRRRIREQEATVMQQNSVTPETNWAEIAPLLDEAVSQLKETDRDAVLLRFFKNLSHQEVGSAMGLGEDAARKRVDRALEKLREHFARHGVTASSTLLATAIAENSVQAAPVGLAENVLGSALASTGTATSAVSLFLALLMSTKTKITLIAIIGLALVATVAIQWQSSASQTAAKSAASLAPAASHPADITLTKPSQIPAQVEMPVLPAANPSNGAGTTSQSASMVNAFVAVPQKDLKSAITLGIHFLEANDLASTLKTLDSPGMREMNQKAGLGDSEEEIAAAMRARDPKTDEYAQQQLDLFRAIQDLTPEISPDGKRATYHLDQPVGGSTQAGFIKVNGFWYYGSGAESDWNAPP